MATQGRPNVSLLPTAGTEVTRAREVQQEVDLRAALARLQASLQQAQLQEQARQFDENSQLRREAMQIDTMFKQADIATQRQAMQFEAQRFGVDVSLRERQLDISEEREERLIKQTAREFGLREDDFKLRAEKFQADQDQFATAEERAERTVAQKRFDELLKDIIGINVIELDATGDPLNPAKISDKAKPLLEELERLSKSINPDNPITGQALMDIIGARSKEAFKQRRQRDAQFELQQASRKANILSQVNAVDRDQRAQEDKLRIENQKNQLGILQQGFNARIEPLKSQFNALLKSAEAVERGALGLEKPEERAAARQRAQELRGEAQGIASKIDNETARFRTQAETLTAAELPTGPTGAERRQQLFQQLGVPQAGGAAQQPQPQPGVPAVPGAAPVDTGVQPAGTFQQEQFKRINTFMRRLQSEQQGLLVSDLAFPETLTENDRALFGNMFQVNAQVQQNDRQIQGITELETRLVSNRAKFDAAFAEKGAKLPDGAAKLFDNRLKSIRSLKTQLAEGNKQAIQQQDKLIQAMPPQTAKIAHNFVNSERDQLNGFIKNLEDQKDVEGATEEEKAAIDKQINAANRDLAGLTALRSKLGNKVAVTKNVGFGIQSTGAALQSVFPPGSARQKEIQGALTQARSVTDPVYMREFGRAGNAAGAGANTPEKMDFRGGQIMQWYREGGIYQLAKDPSEMETIAISGVGVVARFSIGLLPQLFGAFEGGDRKGAMRAVLPIEQQGAFGQIESQFKRLADSRDLDVEDISDGEKLQVAVQHIAVEPPQNILAWNNWLLSEGIDPGTVFNAIKGQDIGGFLGGPQRTKAARGTDIFNLITTGSRGFGIKGALRKTLTIGQSVR